MTNKEQDRLIAYLVDAGEIDPKGDVAAQFLDWRQVHYQAILEDARIRKRSFDRGYQSGCAAMLGGPPPLADDQGVCDHDTPCGCYAEGHAAGMAAANPKRRPPARWPTMLGGPPPLADDQGVCDHDTPCGCYAEGHAAGMAAANPKRRPPARWPTMLEGNRQGVVRPVCP